MSNVVIDGEDVFVDGEMHYPRRLIEELDDAYSKAVYAAGMIPSGGTEWFDYYQKACARVDDARRALEL